MEEPIKIKLSPEQIIEKRALLEASIQNKESTELSIRQFERMLANNAEILINQTISMINKEKQKLAITKHNIIAYSEQIEKGEM